MIVYAVRIAVAGPRGSSAANLIPQFVGPQHDQQIQLNNNSRQSSTFQPLRRMTSLPPAHRILVTGASGLLGRAFIRALTEKHASWKITGLDIVAPPESVLSRLEHFYQADITVRSQLQAAFARERRPDLVLHTAALVPARNARYSTNTADWERIKAVNYGGTVNVLTIALEAGCKRFVYTSSVTAVQDDLDHDYFHVAEDKALVGLAQLHYGRSKLLAESFIQSRDSTLR